MRMILVTSMLGLMLVAIPASQSPQQSRASDSLERGFAVDGRISMDLSAGEYRITGSRENRIRIEWSVRDREKLSEVRARADVRGGAAAISMDGPEHNSGFKVDIQVPLRADLYVRLTAGELTIENIEGDKDIALHAGELNIDVGRPEDYRRVEASVWAGEVDASAYRVSKGGLFRSFDWTGTGPYRLQARLKAGEVRLYSGITGR